MLKSSETINTLGSVSGTPQPESTSPATISASITTARLKSHRRKSKSSSSSHFIMWCRRIRKVPRSFSMKRNSLLWDDCSSDEYESVNTEEDISLKHHKTEGHQEKTPLSSATADQMSNKSPSIVHYSSQGDSVTIRDSGLPQISSSVLENNTFSTVSGYSPSWLFQEQFSPSLPQDHDKVTSTAEKILRTALLCTTYFVLAMIFSLLGLTLLDLAGHLHVTLTKATQLFTSRSLGGVLGAVLMGFLLDHVNDSVAIYSSLLIVAIVLYVTPFMTSYVGLLSIMFVEGIAMSFIQCAASLICVFIWGSCNAPYMLLMHVSYGLGSIFTPLITQPFLSSSYDSSFKVMEETRNSSWREQCFNVSSKSRSTLNGHGYFNCSTGCDVRELCKLGQRSIEEFCNTPISLIKSVSIKDLSSFNEICDLYYNTAIQTGAYNIPSTSANPNGHHSDEEILRWNRQSMTSFTGSKVSQSETPPQSYIERLNDLCVHLKEGGQMDFQFAYCLVGSLCSALAISYFLLWLLKERNLLVKNSLVMNLSGIFTQNHDTKKKWTLPFMAILAIYAFFQAGCETAYGNYLFTYMTEGIGLSKTASSHVVSVHWAMWFVGYSLGTMVTFIAPAVTVICGSIIMTVAFLILQTLVGHCFESVLWTSVAFIGLGQSLLTPALLSWLDTKITVSQRSSSVIMVLNHLGAVIFSAITGVIVTYESFYFNVVIAVCYSVCLVLFINMIVITWYTGNVTSRMDANANMAKEADRQSNRAPKRITLRNGSTLYAPHLRPRFSVVSTTADTSQSQLLRLKCVTIRPAPISLRAVTKFAFNYEYDKV